MFSRQQQVKAAFGYVLTKLAAEGPEGDPDFTLRLERWFPPLCELFAEVYGQREDCLDQLADLVVLTARSWAERPAELRALDARREADPNWFLSNRMLGGVCY